MQSKTPDLSDEQLQVMCESVYMITCECPAQLVDLLRRVRRFRRYTREECLKLVPEAAETHYWLGDRILQLETSLVQLLIEFMEREQLFDDRQQVDLAKLANRNLQAALRQQRIEP